MEDLIALRSIDTNIVVRLLLRDDPKQSALIDALVDQGDLLIPLTVLVETEWVLRGVYKLDRQTVSNLLFRLTGIEGVNLQDPPGVRWALERHATGADLADMIHVIASDTDTFLTFDRKLASGAGDNPRQSVVLVG